MAIFSTPDFEFVRFLGYENDGLLIARPYHRLHDMKGAKGFVIEVVAPVLILVAVHNDDSIPIVDDEVQSHGLLRMSFHRQKVNV